MSQGRRRANGMEGLTAAQSTPPARPALSSQRVRALTLEAYVEPFASSGRYRDFGELAAARGFDVRIYGSAPGTTITRNGDSTYWVAVR